MSISRRPDREAQPGPGRRALEALALALALAFLPELARARYGAVLEPHPGWIAVLILAARYGSGGVFPRFVAAPRRPRSRTRGRGAAGPLPLRAPPLGGRNVGRWPRRRAPAGRAR